MGLFLKTAAGADAVTAHDCAALALRTASGADTLWQARRPGEVWRSAPACPDLPWKDVCWSETKQLFVAVGTIGSIMTSPDGLVWTQRTSPERNSWQAVCYGNRQFVAVGYSGTNRAMTSPDGINWTARFIPSSNWYGVAYGNGRYVAVGQSGTARMAYSTDGATWVELPHRDRYWKGVAFVKGIFAAVSSEGDVATSINGESWSIRTLSGTPTFVHLFSDGERFVALVNGGPARVMTSEDGVEWIPRAAPNKTWLKGAGRPGVLVAIANGAAIMTSHDNGVSWQERPAPVSMSWQGAACGSKRLVAVALNAGKQVMVSD